MAPPKTVRVMYQNGSEELEASSIEQALKNVLKKVKKGELETPLTLEFDAGNMFFSIRVDNTEAVEEVSRLGFMY